MAYKLQQHRYCEFRPVIGTYITNEAHAFPGLNDFQASHLAEF